MSKSDDERRDDKRQTLCKLVTHLGDHHIWDLSVGPTDKGFETVLPTTWRELLDDGLIDDKMSSMGSPAFRLTSYGWVRALTLTGDIDSAEMRDRCKRLAKALKAVIKGRKSHYDEFASVKEISETAGLPAGWVFNAIKSQVLRVVFPDDRWDAQLDQNSPDTVRVSPTFGLNLLEE